MQQQNVSNCVLLRDAGSGTAHICMMHPTDFGKNTGTLFYRGTMCWRLAPLPEEATTAGLSPRRIIAWQTTKLLKKRARKKWRRHGIVPAHKSPMNKLCSTWHTKVYLSPAASPMIQKLCSTRHTKVIVATFLKKRKSLHEPSTTSSGDSKEYIHLSA